MIAIIIIIMMVFICYIYLNRNMNKNKMNNNNVELEQQTPTLEQLINGEVDINKYREALKKRTIENITIQVKENTITKTGATFIISDRNEVFCDYGSEYKIEVKKNGKWEMQKTITDDIIWESISFRPGKKVSEHKKDWSKVYGELQTGEYRLALKVYTNKYEYIYAEFSIK